MLSVAAVISLAALAQAQSSNLSFVDPTKTSGSYSTTSYNATLASAQIAQTDFSNERLAFLWDQVGPVATGILSTTVSPTPEPSRFPQPGYMHPYVPSYYPGDLADAALPEDFEWGMSSSAFQIEVRKAVCEV